MTAPLGRALSLRDGAEVLAGVYLSPLSAVGVAVAVAFEAYNSYSYSSFR